MFDLKINPEKNAILCVLSGKFDEAEAHDYVSKFKDGVDRLEPGMVVITDLTEFVPTDDEVRRILQEGSKYAVERGVLRGIRIVTESVSSKVGNIQLNKTARELGYKVDVVNSLDEAKRLLGW
ncbi:MAG: hypothetical protein R3200_01995 [Xanthomonadales bacterium]|nr:hypothetical protein [Xanthomonadales bacterium]